MAAVAAKSRDWRHARTHRETRHEVTKLELPPDVAQVLSEMSMKLAQSIAQAKDLEARIIALERTVSAITGPILARGAA